MRSAVALLICYFGLLPWLQAHAADAHSPFSDSDATKVLRHLKDGLEGHDDHEVLSALDSAQMEGFFAFRDQIRSFLTQFEQIRFFFRVVQTTADGERGTAVAELQMEADPRNGMPLRRDQEVRITFVRSKKGWKILDFQPRDYFNP